MKFRVFIPFLLLLAPVILWAQEGVHMLTLEHCQQQAIVNFPSYRQHELLGQSSALEQKNLGKNWLPTLNLNGQASYQSDVTKVPTIVPQFAPEPISKDWYKLYLDVSQVIWDGGATRQGKAIEEIDHNLDVQNLEIELYQVKEQVNSLFFTILLLQENSSLLQVHHQTILGRLDEVESAVRNGVVLASNADILKAELLKIEQKMEEIDIAEHAAMQSLSLLIGEPLEEGTRLEMPSPEVDLASGPQNRLEYGLFDMQQGKLDALKKMQGTTLMPKFQAFGQAGVGRPAFDMLNNDFDDYYIIGLRMNWSFWNWNRTRNEKDILEINRQVVDTKRDAFERTLTIDMENKRAEVIKYDKLILKDQEILDLRSKVVKEYASRLENGMITATDYLNELNAESEARLNINIHKIQLVQAKYQYLAAIGQL